MSALSKKKKNNVNLLNRNSRAIGETFHSDFLSTQRGIWKDFNEIGVDNGSPLCF